MRSVEGVLRSQPWASLSPLLPDSAGVPVAIERLREFSRMAIEWNRSVSNLFSKNDEPRILERHIRESLEPARWLAQSGASSWMDFGSGAGFPGMVLAIAGVGSIWHLVESRRPKVLFLRKTCEVLGLSEIVKVHHSRLELLDGAVAEVDAFTSRAVMRIVPTLAIARKFVRVGGACFLWKGSGWRGELEVEAPWKEEWKLEEARDLSGTQASVIKFLRITT